MTREDRIEEVRDMVASKLTDFAFEANDQLTWDEVTDSLTKGFMAMPFVSEYVVCCSAENNVANTKELHADVAFKLEGHVDFIYLPGILGLEEAIQFLTR